MSSISVKSNTPSKNVTNISGVPSWMLSVLVRVMELSGKQHLEEVWSIYPICCEGDCIGAVILYSRENQTHFSETEYKAAACAASFLGKQMEG